MYRFANSCPGGQDSRCHGTSSHAGAAAPPDGAASPPEDRPMGIVRFFQVPTALQVIVVTRTVVSNAGRPGAPLGRDAESDPA